jgi:putative tRNA adenosine deaminase-associated protein
MSTVAYFTAVMARAGAAWRARDVEVDESTTLDDLAESLRSAAIDDGPVLAVVEHEDEWFALVRVDGDDDPRVFVSDLFAASRSAYAELLAPAADVDPDDDEEPAADPDAEDDPGNDPDDDDTEDPEIVIAVWAGETDLLEDLGVSGRVLRKLVEDNADDPGLVLGEVGETVGFGGLLEALR